MVTLTSIFQDAQMKDNGLTNHKKETIKKKNGINKLKKTYNQRNLIRNNITPKHKSNEPNINQPLIFLSALLSYYL